MYLHSLSYPSYLKLAYGLKKKEKLSVLKKKIVELTGVKYLGFFVCINRHLSVRAMKNGEI